MTRIKYPYRLIAAIVGLCMVCLGLLTVRIVSSESFRFNFLPWNLFLAAVPLVLSVWLSSRIQQFGWLRWQQFVLSIAWITFLPNSFYIITDLIHLRPNFEADFLFDIALLTAFVIAGLALGYMSVYVVHNRLNERLNDIKAYGVIGIILLAASFAICLGRYTRWNTWDILLQPAGLLFDVSDRVINPDAHIQTYQTTFVLFAVIMASYVVVYESARLLRSR